MKSLGRLALVGGALLAAIVVQGTIAWALWPTENPTQRMLAVPPQLIPSVPTLDHYQRLIAEGVQWSFINSGGYAVGAVLIALLLGSFAGYALARFDMPAKPLVMLIFVGTMAVPSFAVLLPTQLMFVDLGLFNTRITLSLLYAAHVVPFAVWITRAHFASIPRELEQAALIDGYSRLEAVWKVVLPGAKPALLAAAAFGFLHSWNDYITATTMVDSPELRTLPVALIFFQGFHGRDWGALMAGVVIATIPPVVMFLLFRRYLIGGFSDGSVKG